MPRMQITRESDVIETSRVKQFSGIFDIPPAKKTQEAWDVNLPLDEKEWNIGLIVGPSGCGKTTIINEFFPNDIYNEFEWDGKKSIMDSFPLEMGIKDITGILNSVGFSSPPSWVRPYHVLSNGEKFRVNIARALAESKDLCVIDEFTSVVDRTVGKIGSYAVSKAVRRKQKKFIAVSCHYDIEEWLQPDWVYRVEEASFQWRSLRRRPEIKLEVVKVHTKAWEIFKKHHYLSAKIHRNAQCFVGYWEGIPIAFVAHMHFINNRLFKTKTAHRAVVLPDYQGAGIGNQLMTFIASAVTGAGFDYIGRGANHAMVYTGAKSKKWKMIRKPEVSLRKNPKRNKSEKHVIGNHIGRMVATFRYIGPKMEKQDAEELLGIVKN